MAIATNGCAVGGTNVYNSIGFTVTGQADRMANMTQCDGETLTLTEPAMRRPQAIISIIRNTMEMASALTTTLNPTQNICPLSKSGDNCNAFGEGETLTRSNRLQVRFVGKILRRYHWVNILDDQNVGKALYDRYGQSHPSDHAAGRKQVAAKEFPNCWHFGIRSVLKRTIKSQTMNCGVSFAVTACWAVSWRTALNEARCMRFGAKPPRYNGSLLWSYTIAPSHLLTETQISAEWSVALLRFVMS